MNSFELPQITIYHSNATVNVKTLHVNIVKRPLPPVPIVVQDLHVKPSASFCDFVPNISHPNDPHCRS